ncbi:hypothetical protein OIV83_004396 [Microbotryomycetes sp. JL201]|nr:hypothetical protein OIV83_004396 [Microbotryomycetes sp. JL201]
MSGLPVMFWVHGGSFIQGSATGHGLDGSRLASRQNIVVITVQTRLGVLGYLRNAKLGFSGNYGLKDLVASLTFGGDPTRITVAGQSSGAELVKTLLVTPSAATLFHRVILQSAPLDYTDQSNEIGNRIGQMVATQLDCPTPACMRSKPVSRIIDSQSQIVALGQSGQLPGLRLTESFFRPVVDGQLVKHDFRQAMARSQHLASSDKSVMMTVMKDDAALGIFGLFPEPQSPAVFEPIVHATYGERASDIIASNVYTPANDLRYADATRDAMASLGTDFTWLCPVQQVAINMTTTGHAPIYFAQFDSGISYLNGSVPYTRDKATHEDDILTVFGTAGSSMTDKQQTLVTEVQARWGAFVRGGSPNTAEFRSWLPVQASGNLNVLKLGNSTTGRSILGGNMLRPEACSIGSVSPLDILKGHKSGHKHSTEPDNAASAVEPDDAAMQDEEAVEELHDSPTTTSADQFSRTNTTSSGASSSVASASDRQSKHSRFSFGHHSTSKDSALTSIRTKSASLPPPFERPHDLDPIGLAQLGLSVCLSVPGYPIEEMERVIIPALFHVPGYSHRVNCRETDYAGLLEIVKFLRTKFSKIRLRFKSELMDQDGTASMKQAAVGITYELIVERYDDPHPKHERIERRAQAYCISKIFEGRIDWFPGSVWASVPLLTAAEKGYTDDVLEKRIVDLAVAYNGLDVTKLFNGPTGTVPALVAPFEHTVNPEVPTKFKSLADSVEIAKFLDESTLSPASSHSAPKLSPATVQGSTDEKYFIELVHKPDAPDPNFLLLSLRNDEERKGKNANLPGNFLRGRQTALEQYQKETKDSGSAAFQSFYENKIKENGGLLAIYEGKADAAGFYKLSQDAWANLSKLVTLLESKLAAQYLVGDQLSLADIHVGAYFARIFAVAGAEKVSEVTDGTAVNKLNAQLVNGVKVGPKLEQYLKTLFERQSFQQTYAENMH